ncbi:hypothetical protein EVAR_102903_1 [Eumeta japonica]|uniref:Uncharacterized protein n=1 Tax=Eumeta variegata TaxID=151549 RepID=A0A4C1ZLX2_EUMVA|nr:hypothetical protein EVAR_102903_1 [Eumeta japonica]
MDASALNIEERPMRLSLCKLTSRGGATRAEGGVPAAPRQSEAVASPHATYSTQEYDEMLKMDIKTECDVEDSAIVQVLATSHAHILESSMAGPSLLVKEEGDFILKTETEVDEMMIKQELDIEPISLKSKITPHLLLPADEAGPDTRPNTSFCEGTAPAPLCTAGDQEELSVGTPTSSSTVTTISGSDGEVVGRYFVQTGEIRRWRTSTIRKNYDDHSVDALTPLAHGTPICGRTVTTAAVLGL